MNVSLFDRFISYKNYYHFLYILILFLFITIIILVMLFFNNVISLNYKAIVSKNDNLVISDLDYLETETILESKRIEINSQKINYKVLEVDENLNNYTVKLKINNYFLDSQIVDLKVVLKEENLYQFVVRNIKGG